MIQIYDVGEQYIQVTKGEGNKNNDYVIKGGVTTVEEQI